MNRLTTTAAAIVLAALGTAGCEKLGLGPQPRSAAPPAEQKNAVYAEKADLSTPEGPMYVLLQAAQERDEQLFMTAVAPSAVGGGNLDEAAFRKFRKKVLTNKVTPVPESVQMLSDTEAVVKLRNSRGREIPVHVQKFDDKWLITSIDAGARTIKNPERRKQGAPAAPASAPAPEQKAT